MAATPRRQRVQQRKSALKIAAERRAKRQRIVRWSSVLGVALVLVLAGTWLVRALDDDGNTVSGGSGGMYEGIAQNGMVLGDPDAPATLVEYADYLCPHCAEFVKDDQAKLIADFVKTGDKEALKAALSEKINALPVDDIVSFVSSLDQTQRQKIADKAAAFGMGMGGGPGRGGAGGRRHGFGGGRFHGHGGGNSSQPQ